MTCATTNKCCFRGRGKIYLGKYDDCCGTGDDGLDPYPLIHVGNASDLTVNATVNEITQPDYTSCTGGNYCSTEEIQDPTVTFNLKCSDPDNLARAWAGDSNEKAAETVAQVTTLRAWESLIPFRSADGQAALGVNLATVAVVLDGVTLVLDQDYEMTDHGIVILEDGPNTSAMALPTVVVPPATIPAGLPLEIAFEHDGFSFVDMFTNTGIEYRLYFEGFNTAANCSPVAFELYRVKIQPSSGVPLISDEFAEWDVTGSLLKDECRPATRSQYGTLATL